MMDSSPRIGRSALFSQDPSDNTPRNITMTNSEKARMFFCSKNMTVFHNQTGKPYAVPYRCNATSTMAAA